MRIGLIALQLFIASALLYMAINLPSLVQDDKPSYHELEHKVETIQSQLDFHQKNCRFK